MEIPPARILFIHCQMKWNKVYGCQADYVLQNIN